MPAPLAADRLRHVFRHLRVRYHVPTGLADTLGLTESAARIIRVGNPAADAFFRGSAPYPTTADTSWRTVRGLRVPVFWNDVAESAFYWLSGWQEVNSAVRDAQGRFPYAASLQAQVGCITVPVADLLLDEWRQELEAQTGSPLPARAVGPAVALSHDIDALLSGWRGALKHGHWRAAAGKLVGRDPFDNLPAVARLAQELTGAPSTFYLLGAQGTHPLGPNADYDVAAPAVQARLSELEQLGCAVHLHGSFGASDDPAQLRRELTRLGRPGAGVRFHYLRFDPVRTPALLAAAGVGHDATLGFAERAGFRHGTAHPFWLYDFNRQESFETEYRPLHAMDVTFRNAGYQPTPPAEIPAVVADLGRAARLTGGTLSILWHNEYLVPWEHYLGAATLRAVVRAAQG